MIELILITQVWGPHLAWEGSFYELCSD